MTAAYTHPGLAALAEALRPPDGRPEPTSADNHARLPDSRPQFLDEFRELNPFLAPQKGSNRCGNLWNLLTPRHRLDPDCCNPVEDSTDAGICFTDHLEPWKHKVTGLSVLVAHPYCGHQEDIGEYLDHREQRRHRRDEEQSSEYRHHREHRKAHKFLRARGLWYKVSSTSWYSHRTTLLVIARSDLLDEIDLPFDYSEDAYDEPNTIWPSIAFGRDNDERDDDIDWEMRMVEKLAAEDLARSRAVQKARQKEMEGDDLNAFRFYLDNALVDRSGGFDELAHRELGGARRILSENPSFALENFLYFHNELDRDYVLSAAEDD